MIQVDGLCKRFGRFEALHEVSFVVPEGSAFALIGANGAGKTTCIKVLMNILEPTRGTATVLGVDSRRLSPDELSQIGYVSENQQMPSRLTVAEFFDYLRPFYSRWDRGLEIEIRRQLRLPPERKIGNLSHGMRMKMALACALPFRPRLLVLDEPFNGLDPLVRDEFMEGLLRQAGEMTVFISSHELHEIDGVASHLAFLDEGRLLFVEPMDELNRRFREVHVTFQHEAASPRRPPREWLQVQARGNVLSFVDTCFSQEKLAAQIEAVAGAAQRIDTQPMALRSIFTALARAARDENYGNGFGPSPVEPEAADLKVG
jgi:ABC-2 type transport system ATP-binding protein